MSLLGGSEFVLIRNAGLIRYINVAAIKEIRLSSDSLLERIEKYITNFSSALTSDDYISIYLFPTGGGYVSEELKCEHRYSHMLDVYAQIKHLLVQRKIKQV